MILRLCLQIVVENKNTFSINFLGNLYGIIFWFFNLELLNLCHHNTTRRQRKLWSIFPYYAERNSIGLDNLDFGFD